MVNVILLIIELAMHLAMLAGGLASVVLGNCRLICLSWGWMMLPDLKLQL